jgi:hypothetical protein
MYQSGLIITRRLMVCFLISSCTLLLSACELFSPESGPVSKFASVKLGLMTPLESDALTEQAKLGLYSATLVRGRAPNNVRQTYYTISDEIRVQADTVLSQQTRAAYSDMLLVPLQDNLRLFLISAQDYPQTSITASLSLVKMSAHDAVLEATFVVFDSSGANSAGILWYCVTRRVVSLQGVNNHDPYAAPALQKTFSELTNTALKTLTKSF